MWSQRYERTRKGDRAEYLAQYILSSFTVCVPVLRQEDTGIDFYCSLLRKVDEDLRPYLAFNVQVKSSDDSIEIGGVTKGGKWREHEIQQFCSLETPLLIGIVDIADQRLDLFTTASRYFVGRWKNGIIPRRIDLIPYAPEGEGHLGDGEIKKLKTELGMPDEVWKLPIGQPIVRIPIADSENEQKRETIKQLLEPYLQMDQQNSVLARLGLGYWEWPLIMRPNVPLQEVGAGLAINSPPSPAHLLNMLKLIAGLLFSYHNGKQREKILPWIPILEQFNLGDANPFVREVIAKAIAYAQEPPTA